MFSKLLVLIKTTFQLLLILTLLFINKIKLKSFLYTLYKEMILSFYKISVFAMQISQQAILALQYKNIYWLNLKEIFHINKHSVKVSIIFISLISIILSINSTVEEHKKVKEIMLPPMNIQSIIVKESVKEIHNLTQTDKNNILFNYYLKNRHYLFHKNKNIFVSFKTADRILEQKELFLAQKIEKDYSISLDEMMCLVENAYREARNQSLSGKQAVTNTVLNRMNRTGEDSCTVIRKGRTNNNGDMVKDKCHFSWMCEREQYNDFMDEYNLKNEWLIALKAVKKAFKQDITRGATLYHANYVKPWWVKEKDVFFTKKVDDHLFYNEKNYGKNKNNI